MLESALCHADFAVLAAKSATAAAADDDENDEQASVCAARTVNAQESLALATSVYELVSQLTGKSVKRVGGATSKRAPRRCQQQPGLGGESLMGMEDTGVQMGIAMRGVSGLRDVAHAVKIVQTTNDMLGLR